MAKPPRRHGQATATFGLLSEFLGSCWLLSQPAPASARGATGGRGHGLFQAFPPEFAEASQLSVFEAESVQLVGSVSAAALERMLREQGDHSWRPLRLGLPVDAPEPGSAQPIAHQHAASTEISDRVPFSIGVGDFRNTSIGGYFEFALAFPACSVGYADPPVDMTCRTFMSCQDQLPDCAHTYMWQSYASSPEAVGHIRAAGVDSQLATKFEFKTSQATGTSSGFVAFDIKGPGGEDVLDGSIETSPPLNSEKKQGFSRASSLFAIGRGPGYRLQLFTGTPNILQSDSSTESLHDGSANARHLCAFPDDLDAGPARIADGSLNGGQLLAELEFELEGAFHLQNLRLVRLPPMLRGKAVAAGTEVAVAPPPAGGSTGKTESRSHNSRSQSHSSSSSSSSSSSNSRSKAAGSMAGQSSAPPSLTRSTAGDVEEEDVVYGNRAPWAESAAARAAAGRGPSAPADFPWQQHMQGSDSNSIYERTDTAAAAEGTATAASSAAAASATTNPDPDLFQRDSPKTLLYEELLLPPQHRKMEQEQQQQQRHQQQHQQQQQKERRAQSTFPWHLQDL